MDRIDTATRPLDALCDDIVVRYHAGLHRRLARIRQALIDLTMNGSSRTLEMMHQAFARLAARIESHLSKEEHLLFPAIIALAAAERDRRGPARSTFVTVLYPIRMLETEHANIEADLGRVRALALDATEPEALTASWRRCMDDLAELDRALRELHGIENEVLFPRALELERRLL